MRDLCVSITGGATPLRANAAKYAKTGIRFLRIQNITPFGIDLSDSKYISQEAHEGELARSQLQVGDVLMTITGRIGTAAVVRAEHLPANINQHIVRIRPALGKILPEYLVQFINSEIGTALSNRGVTGTTRIALDYEAIREIPIPVPPINMQTELVNELAIALDIHSAKLAQSDALLKSIDDFVLSELGLVVPKKDNRFIFAVRLNELQKRYDADYQCPRYRALRNSIEASKHPVALIKDLCRYIETGFAAGRQDQAEDEFNGIPHIRPLNITGRGQLIFDGTKYVPQKRVKSSDILRMNEVLFNNTNSTEWVGKTTVFPGGRDCACSNHITRLAFNEMRVLPKYVAALFNALRGLGLFGLLSTNFNNQAGINTATLGDVSIPIPALAIQQKIVVDVAQRYADAVRIQEEASVLWKTALKIFDQKILVKGEKA